MLELETIKAYIKTHQKTGFIQPFLSPTSTIIFFDSKSDSNCHLCIDY